MNNCKLCGFLGLVWLAVAGCSDAPARVIPEAPNANSSSAALELLDANKDGVLDASELEPAPGLKAGFKQADSDQDGKLSAAEIDARLQAWAASKVGRLSVACVVTRKGTPLANAEVRFVPEPFLGSELQAAVGTSDAQGFAIPSAPENAGKPPGIAPGFYRVEIKSTSGEELPAKYNTATTFGAEIAPDAEGMMMGPLKFELD